MSNKTFWCVSGVVIFAAAASVGGIWPAWSQWLSWGYIGIEKIESRALFKQITDNNNSYPPSLTFKTHPSSFFLVRTFEGILTQNNVRQGHSNDHQSSRLDFVTKTVWISSHRNGVNSSAVTWLLGTWTRGTGRCHGSFNYTPAVFKNINLHAP